MRHDHESIAVQPVELPGSGTAARHDADYVFYELTRSICPICSTMTLDRATGLSSGYLAETKS